MLSSAHLERRVHAPDLDLRSRIDWRCDDIPVLTLDDLAAIAGILRRHAAASQIERLERRHADRADRPWDPLVLEVDGRRLDAADLGCLADPNVGAVRLRTFGHAAAFAAGRQGVRLLVDDDPELARQTAAAILRVLGRRRRPGLGLFASDWVAPSFALFLPVVASVLDAPGDPGRATWSGLLAAAVLIAVWAWWRNRVWSARRLVVGAADGGGLVSAPPTLVPAPASAADRPVRERVAPGIDGAGSEPHKTGASL